MAIMVALWNSATPEHHGDGLKDDSRREFHYKDFQRVYESCITSVEKCKLLTFLFVALHAAGIKQMWTG